MKSHVLSMLMQLYRRINASLVRRILLAQILFLALLWAAMYTYVATSVLSAHGLFNSPERMDSLLVTVSQLSGDRESLVKVITSIDQFMRKEDDTDDHEDLRIFMTLRKGQEVIYATPGKPGALQKGPEGELTEQKSGGIVWLTLTKTDPLSGISIILSRRSDRVFSLFSSDGFKEYLIPLFLTLPLLIIPTWLAVYMAVSPVRRLADDLNGRAAHELEPLSHNLQAVELTTIVDAINTLLVRLKEAQQREHGFIGNAAHELRTPLAAIRVNAEAIGKHSHSGLKGGAAESLIYATDRASRIIDQLLNLLRVDAGEHLIEASKVSDLNDLIQRKLAELYPLADKAGVQLEFLSFFQSPVRIHADAFDSMIDNVINNAIKYSGSGSIVRVSLKHGHNAAEVIIEDSGPGIPAEWRASVMNRFFRIPGASGSGSGLGLSIVQSVVAYHNGTMELADSADLGGLKVSISLPVV